MYGHTVIQTNNIDSTGISVERCEDYFRKKLIDKDSPIPLYHQIKEIILEFIQSRDNDEMIPTEHDFQAMYSVSRATIRQAINELAADGYLYRKKGTGTFVTKDRLVQFGYLESLFDTALKLGHKISTKVLEFNTINDDQKISDILQLQQGSEIIRLRRLRFVDKKPNHIVVNHLAAEKFPRILNFDFEKESLMRVIKEEYGVSLRSQTSTIEAHLSGEYESELLKISVGSPIQHVETVNYTLNEIPVDFYFVQYRGDLHQIKYQIKF